MPVKAIHRFLSSEAKGGILLFAAAMAAFILSNSPAAEFYQALFSTPFALHSSFVTAKPFLTWINDGLMTFFFLLVGLELKRECLVGHLSELQKIILPGMAALGGMMVPALIYVAITWHHSVALQGWAIPVATDIAFALGLLSLFGKNIPVGLRLFLMTLAIVDDVGAILIIALFQEHGLSWTWFALAGLMLFFLIGLNRAGVQRLSCYLVFGLLLWGCMLESGVHATIAGVLIALVIPLRLKVARKTSPLEVLEKFLLLDPITVGIVAGLFLGKQAGVFGFAWLMIKMGWAKLPERATWLQLYGVALLCGIGFTMSLFIGMLAFQGESAGYLIKVKAGVLLASLLSGIVGAVVLRCAVRKKR